MAKYGVIVGLSFVGEDIEEAQVPIMIDALDLEEVFFELPGVGGSSPPITTISHKGFRDLLLS